MVFKLPSVGGIGNGAATLRLVRDAASRSFSFVLDVVNKYFIITGLHAESLVRYSRKKKYNQMR